MRQNSYRPNGVLIAVFVMSSSVTGNGGRGASSRSGKRWFYRPIGGKILDVRDGVAGWRGDFVQPAVVPTREPATVTFGNPVEWRNPGAGGRAYDSHVENFIP